MFAAVERGKVQWGVAPGTRFTCFTCFTSCFTMLYLCSTYVPIRMYSSGASLPVLALLSLLALLALLVASLYYIYICSIYVPIRMYSSGASLPVLALLALLVASL